MTEDKSSMSDELLQQLADDEIPPVPETFDEKLHGRVNRTLLTRDLFDFGVRATPWAMGIFGQALIDLLGFTVSGRLQNERPRRNR